MWTVVGKGILGAIRKYLEIQYVDKAKYGLSIYDKTCFSNSASLSDTIRIDIKVCPLPDNTLERDTRFSSWATTRFNNCYPFAVQVVYRKARFTHESPHFPVPQDVKLSQLLAQSDYQSQDLYRRRGSLRDCSSWMSVSNELHKRTSWLKCSQKAR